MATVPYLQGVCVRERERFRALQLCHTCKRLRDTFLLSNGAEEGDCGRGEGRKWYLLPPSCLFPSHVWGNGGVDASSCLLRGHRGDTVPEATRTHEQLLAWMNAFRRHTFGMSRTFLTYPAWRLIKRRQKQPSNIDDLQKRRQWLICKCHNSF